MLGGPYYYFTQESGFDFEFRVLEYINASRDDRRKKVQFARADASRESQEVALDTSCVLQLKPRRCAPPACLRVAPAPHTPFLPVHVHVSLMNAHWHLVPYLL